MKYYKKIVDDGFQLLTYSVTPYITNPLIVEITEEEYNSLRAELEAQWAAESTSSETIPYTDIGEG